MRRLWWGGGGGGGAGEGGDQGCKLSGCCLSEEEGTWASGPYGGKGKRWPDLGAKPHLLCVSGGGPEVWMSDGHSHAEAI